MSNIGYYQELAKQAIANIKIEVNQIDNPTGKLLEMTGQDVLDWVQIIEAKLRLLEQFAVGMIRCEVQDNIVARMEARNDRHDG